MLKTLNWDSAPPPTPSSAAALRGDTLALTEARHLVLASRGGTSERVHIVRTLQLPFVASRIALSSSERYLLVRDSMRLEIWDVANAFSVLEVSAKDPSRAGFSGTFAVCDGREILIWTDGSELLGLDVATNTLVFSSMTSTFRVAANPFVSGSRLIIPGYFHGETKESLAGMELAQLMSDPQSITDGFQRKQPIIDSAYRICAGPASDGGLVVFRDPEEDENEDLDEDDDPSENDDVWGFRGFYVRGSDGEAARVPWNGPLTSFSPIVASTTRVVVGCTDGIHLVSTIGKEMTSPMEARWLAASPDGAEVLAQTPDGTLVIL